MRRSHITYPGKIIACFSNLLRQHGFVEIDRARCSETESPRSWEPRRLASHRNSRQASDFPFARMASASRMLDPCQGHDLAPSSSAGYQAATEPVPCRGGGQQPDNHHTPFTPGAHRLTGSAVTNSLRLPTWQRCLQRCLQRPGPIKQEARGTVITSKCLARTGQLE
jgi:hypothetical protein